MYKIVAGINIQENESVSLKLCEQYFVKIETCFLLFLCVVNADGTKGVSALHYQPKPDNFIENEILVNSLLTIYANKGSRVKQAYIVFRDYLPLMNKIIQSLKVNYKTKLSPQEIYSAYQALDKERKMIAFILSEKFEQVEIVSCPFKVKTLATNKIDFFYSCEKNNVQIHYQIQNNDHRINNILFPFKDTDKLNIFSQALYILMLSYLFYFVFLQK